MSNEISSDDPGLFRRTFRRHWVGMAVCWFVGSLAVASLIYLEVKPQYRAFSMLRVEPPSPSLYGINTSYETFDMFLQTQMQLLKSPNVLTAATNEQKAAALKRVQMAVDVVQELKKVIEVKVTPGTYLIEVSMTSRESYECAMIVNAVVNSYLMMNEEWADGMTRTQIKKLEDYLRELENKTDELERRWLELASKNEVRVKPLKKYNEKDADEPERITIEQFKRLDDELFAIRLEIVQAVAWLEATKAPKSNAEMAQRDEQARVATETKIRELKVKEKALLALAEGAKVENNQQAADAVQIQLIRDERASINGMQEAVKRRLEQLRYESRGETRVRLVSPASVSSKPIEDLRPLLFTLTPFVMMIPTLCLFLVIESIWRTRFRPSLTPIIPNPES